MMAAIRMIQLIRMMTWRPPASLDAEPPMARSEQATGLHEMTPPAGKPFHHE
jgi:hypothetical protein